MKIKKNELELKQGIEREWIITNGIGGYASSTILGINTRKYHGLLVVPLTPPARRHLILSKLDETIEIDNERYDIYSNICRDFISEGYKYQQEFEKEYIPSFKYQVKDVSIEKSICMEYGKNTVCVLYKIQNGIKDAKFIITPIINFRDFHTMNTNHIFRLKQDVKEQKIRIEIDDFSSNPIYMNLSDGKYIKHENDTFKNMHYIEEDKRGFFPEENHAVPRKIRS